MLDGRGSWSRWVGAGLLTLAVVGGCSSSGDDEADGSPADATSQDEGSTTGATTADDSATEETSSGLGSDNLCALVPEEAVEEIIGLSVQVGIDTAQECTYDQESSTEHFGVLGVGLEDGGAEQFEFDRTHPVGSGIVEEVSGVGDAAIYQDSIDMLRVLIGDQIVTFAVIDFNVTDKRGAAIELANELISNLS